MKKCLILQTENDNVNPQNMDNNKCESGAFDSLSLLYKGVYGETPECVRLPGAGSDRVYSRLQSGERSVIATEGADAKENRAFVELARVFRRHSANVPEIIAVSDDFSRYLQEDLGDQSLLPLLSTPSRMELSAKTLRALVRLQTVPEGEWRDAVMCAPFSRRLVMWDLNYFKYEFLKPSGIPFDEEELEDDMERLASDVESVDGRLWGFMYRDCQSRNVMIRDGEPWWIDFQGGRKGPMIYDAVSFLWQAKAGFTKEERWALLEVYADELSKTIGVEPRLILAEVGKFALLRTLQVLGAYGFRGLVEKKAHFIESIPAAVRNLAELAEEGALDRYPEIRKIAREALESRFMKKEEPGRLTVKVFSFSYKKGYPEDLSGNGGGFMFDCRGMHNPGRYDEYKPLTGLDKPVRDFLEEKGEVGPFGDKAFDIVAPTIDRYIKRGFSSLQVGFGCTGGRHRSVYCAQAFAERVAKEFPEARVVLCHREQGIDKEF